MLKERNLRFPVKPRLVPDLHVFTMPDGLGIQVRGCESPVIFRGQVAKLIVPWLFPLLDGTRTVEDIVRLRPAEFLPSQIERALLLALTKGLISEGDVADHLHGEFENRTDEVIHRQLLFWGRKVGFTRNNSCPEQAQQKLRKAHIVLIGNGLFGSTTYDVLQRSGCTKITCMDWGADGFFADSVSKSIYPPSDAVPVLARSIDEVERWLGQFVPEVDVIITATRNAPSSLFELINQHALRSKSWWLRGNDDSTNIEVGPAVNPFSSGCFTCMQLRQISAADFAIEDELYERHLATDPDSAESKGIGESVSIATIGASILSAEAIRILTMVTLPATENTVLTITADGKFRSDPFVRVPRCPDCYRGVSKTSVEFATKTKAH